MNLSDELNLRLEKIGKVFDINKILSLKIDRDY